MLSALDRREVKGVVRLAISDAGGQENACHVSRITRHKSFSEYADADVEDRQMPIDVAVDLDQFNGNGRIIRWMARRLGFLLVPVPSVSPAASEATALIAAAKASADAVSAGWEAHADGVLTAEERAGMAEHIDRTVAIFESLRLLVAGEGRQ